jgi:hypothetical protein
LRPPRGGGGCPQRHCLIFRGILLQVRGHPDVLCSAHAAPDSIRGDRLFLLHGGTCQGIGQPKLRLMLRSKSRACPLQKGAG